MKILNLHYRGFVYSLIRIIKRPVEHVLNILTITVIVTALSISIIIGKSITNWQQNTIIYPQISVYLKSTATDSDRNSLEYALNKFDHKIIKNFQFISKADGLKQLQQDNELKDIASNVISESSNPLPDVITINTDTADISKLDTLSRRIGAMSFVDNVQMDTSYANKISELTIFVNTIIHMLQLSFAIIMGMVIYNMIRLQMSLRQDEIIVSRLIGAPNSFIMRPLVYYATIQLIIGVLLAFAMTRLFEQFVNSLFSRLSTLFGQNFFLMPLDKLQMIQIMLCLIIFGIFAVFLAVRWVFRYSYVK